MSNNAAFEYLGKKNKKWPAIKSLFSKLIKKKLI